MQDIAPETPLTIELRTGPHPEGDRKEVSGSILVSVPMKKRGESVRSRDHVIEFSGDCIVEATGIAEHYVLRYPTGEVAWQGAVGTSGADINLERVNLVAGEKCSLDFTLALTREE